jgi:Tat protein translocase TatB subunit
MPNLSPMEILVVGVVALIVFGPNRLPEIARTIGRFLHQMRQMASDVRAEFEAGLDTEVEDEPAETATPNEPLADEAEEPAPAPEIAPAGDPDDPDSGER